MTSPCCWRHGWDWEIDTRSLAGHVLLVYFSLDLRCYKQTIVAPWLTALSFLLHTNTWILIMAQESSSIELQALALPDDKPFISDKQTTWPQSLSRLKWRLFGKKTTDNWKKTLYFGSASTVVVLMFNVGFVIWTAKHRGPQDNPGILFSGSCDKSKKISTGLSD